MKHLFIPYELALLAKNKGVDEDFFGYYDLSNRLQLIAEVENNYWDPFPADYIKAPLYQQIIDWFREKHKIIIYPYIDIEYNYDSETLTHIKEIKYSCELRVDYVLQWYSLYNEFTTHQDALNWGISKAFESI